MQGGSNTTQGLLGRPEHLGGRLSADGCRGSDTTSSDGQLLTSAFPPLLRRASPLHQYPCMLLHQILAVEIPLHHPPAVEIPLHHPPAVEIPLHHPPAAEIPLLLRGAPCISSAPSTKVRLTSSSSEGHASARSSQAM